MILVVGATGALGGMIASDLLAQDETVRVLVRPGSDYTRLVELGAQPVMGDLKDTASLRRACDGAATVITTANSAARGGADTLDAVDRRGNHALIDAAAAAGVGHFIFVSALGAHPESPAEFLRAKAEAERHLQQSGMTWTVLQPDVFMDVWIPMLVGLPVSENRPVTLVSPASHRHAFVAARDVSGFAVAAVTKEAARNATVVVGGPQAVSWSDVVHVAEDVLGRGLEVRLVEQGEELPGLPAVVSQLAAALETYETVIDMSGAVAEYGVELTPLPDFLEGLFARPLEA